MKNNKKGFTLVELLAVIVILAVVILIAVTAVIPRMNQAKRKAFEDEALMLIKGAEEYMVDNGMSSWPSKIMLTTLIGSDKYVEIKNGKDYSAGCIKYNSTLKAPVIYIVDGTKYEIIGKSAAQIKSDGAAEYGTGIGSNCS